MGTRIKVNIGQKFNQLTILSLDGTRNGHQICTCICDCGNHTTIRVSALPTNNTTSCGCVNRDGTRKPNTGKRTVGIKHDNGEMTIEYQTWKHIRSRCNKERDPKYPIYGGRGIKVCERWDNSFPSFLADMGKRPDDCNSIDRIDVNGNYEPSNCRWATPKIQAANKRNNVYLLWQGEKVTQSEFARRLGINPKSVEFQRKRGLSEEQIICIYKSIEHVT